MKDGSVVELRALLAAAVPLLGAFGEADEVGYRLGCILLEEFADDGSFRCFECCVGARVLCHLVLLLNKLVSGYEMREQEASPPRSRRAGKLSWGRGGRGWCRGGCGGWNRRRWRHGLTLAHDRYAIDDHRGEGLVFAVALHAGDGRYEQNRVRVALAEDGVLAVELRHGVFGDEEL